MKKNRKPIKFSKPEYIRFRVLRSQLVNITIETGEENIFIPDENRFIVQKHLLANKPNLLFECATLKTVDFTKFDFSEITTMKNWFNGCVHLEDVVFPKPVFLNRLKSLKGCFANTNIKTLDLSSWHIDNNIEMELFCYGCFQLASLKLPVGVLLN